ncbi:MAG: GNAT family N-acetyltransferase [Calditrichaeota bacterium]|nr:MAG: GNAT family N-acetyltransferase [Calditrichota bacterium]MBL1204960.1 GNAT family N-acetyltransferase [Calditrichota bacterium]NOG44790.1 GNAT family N-acetyltransferase [Calditrichota bacterium]
MKLEIRTAIKEDCPLVLDFIRDLAKYENLEHEVIADVTKLERTLFSKNAFAEVFLGYENDKPVCFALIFKNYSTFLAKPGIYLEDLFVKEESRGKGYGKQMLAFLAKLAVERDCGRLEWSVLDWNKPAINFYESLGAIAMKEWFGFRMTETALNKLADSIDEK